MLDIFERIDFITDKYGIDKKKRLKDQIGRLMEKVLADAARKYGNRVIVRGLRKEDKTHSFLTLVERHMDIIGVSDSGLKEKELTLSDGKTIPVIPPDQEIPHCDVYLIRALEQGIEIFSQVKGHIPEETQIIDIYLELNKVYGMRPSYSWEQLSDEIDYSGNRVKDAIQHYRGNRNEQTLLNLLGQCLCIGDFASFFMAGEEGKEIISHSDLLKRLITDVEALIDEIKQEIASRKNKLNGKKDIVWQWIDATGYWELDYIPKVKKRIMEGIFFTNAYSPTPYTTATARQIWYRENRNMTQANEGSYSRKEIKESHLHQLLDEHQYEFNVFGQLKAKLGLDYRDEEVEFCTSSATLQLRMLQELLRAEGKCFFIVHNVVETHPPFATPWDDGEGGPANFTKEYHELRDKMAASSGYVDKVIDFYSELLADQTIGIFMSDHGKWGFLDRQRYSEEVIHTFLGITNLEIKAEVSRLFSYHDFDLLIKWLCFMNEQNGEEEMLIGDIPIYSKGLRLKVMEQGADVEELCSAYMGINTKTDKYVLLETGKEHYFLKEEGEKCDRIGQEEYQNRILYLKKRLQPYMKETAFSIPGNR